ncbi:Signal-transduction histidine kinase senX3 [compost metagenome]
MKYSPESSTVTVGYEPNGSQVKIYVQDQGIGIEEKDQQKLFKRFNRIENENTKHTTGFGIGLYLVAEFLRYHHTKIQVDSKYGEGSTFYFYLDIEPLT